MELDELTFEERMFRVYIPAPKVSREDLIKKLWKKVKFQRQYPPEFITSVLSYVCRDYCVYEIAQMVREKFPEEDITPEDVYNVIATLWRKGYLRFIALKSPDDVLKTRVEKRFIAAPLAKPAPPVKLPEVKTVPIPEEILETVKGTEIAKIPLSIDGVARNVLHALLDRNDVVLWSILVQIPVHPISLVTRQGIKITSETNLAAIVNTLWHTSTSYVGREPFNANVDYVLVEGSHGFVFIKGFKVKDNEFVLAVATDENARRRLSILVRDVEWAINEMARDFERIL